MKCAVCGNEINGRYWRDGWGNVACVHHEVKTCFACWRIIGKYSTLSSVTGQIGYKMGENRQVCGLCQETCVNSTSDIAKSRDFVIRLLGKVGFKIETNGLESIKVITKEEMQKKSPNAEGLCVSTIHPNNPKLTTSQIFILNGMPKIKFESVLAHEILHFWIFYNGIEHNDSVEGFCNIGEALVLNFYTSRQGSQLADYLKEAANSNPDYYYGVKFIEQKKKLQKMGWENYINDILKRKKITP